MTTASGLDPLMDFRLAYLRALAGSWTQWSFDQPVNEQTGFIKDLLSGNDIQALLQQSFGMRVNWPDMAVCLKYRDDKSTGWQPVRTAGWVGQDDQFIITLPQKPENDSTAIEALAAYYQRFPTLTGVAATVSADDSSLAGVDGPPPLQSGALPTGLGVPGSGPGSLLAFGSVILRAIALAWTDGPDSTFYRALTNDGQTVPSPAQDASTVLSQWFGYNNPFNFKIQFLGAGALRWDGTQWQYPHGPAGPTREKPNAVVLHYPSPPDSRQYASPFSTGAKSTAALWPIALTSYNNTGEAYPFTCMAS
jgi:ribosomally synthesized peptide (two-chain TOMM family)